MDYPTGTWTLNELEPNGAGEPRWSAGVNGPRVYLTCDRKTAVQIVTAVNSHAQLVEACRHAVESIDWALKGRLSSMTRHSLLKTRDMLSGSLAAAEADND